MKRTISRRAAFAEIQQDTRGSEPHVFSLKYRKTDGSTGYKARVRKSTRSQPGTGKYRGNVKLNHVLLVEDLDNNNQPINLKIDLLVEYNGQIIDHTV